MSPDHLKALLEGYYVTIPTSFEDVDGPSMIEPVLPAYVRFLIDAGLTADYATFLARGAAVKARNFPEVARMLVKEAMPYHESNGTLWAGRCRYAFAEESVAAAAL